jgi:hypothetical protein
MAYDKLVEFANLVYEKTKNGEITWEKTPQEGVFQTSFPKYSVMVRNHSFAGPVFSILDDYGEVIEELSYAAATNSGLDMDLLAELARRQAMGVEQALDELLSELKKPREKKSANGR